MVDPWRVPAEFWVFPGGLLVDSDYFLVGFTERYDLHEIPFHDLIIKTKWQLLSRNYKTYL